MQDKPLCIMYEFIHNFHLKVTQNAHVLPLSPDPPSQIQALCSTLPLQPRETVALLLHSSPHTGTKHFPAVPAL